MVHQQYLSFQNRNAIFFFLTTSPQPFTVPYHPTVYSGNKEGENTNDKKDDLTQQHNPSNYAIFV